MLPTSPAPRPEDPFSDFDSYLNREAEPPAQPAAPSVQASPEPQATADPFSDFDSYLSRESQKPFLPPPIPGVAEGVEAELQFGNGTRTQPTVMEQLGGVGRAVVTGGQQLLGGLGTALETAGQGMQQPGITGGALAGVPLQAIGEVLSKGGEAYARDTYDIERERQAMAQQSPGWGFAQDVAAQVPQIAAAAATGGGAPALALLGASAAGQGIQQAEAEGATPGEAVAYGATSGLIEAGTERIGTIPLVDKILKRAIVGPVVKPGAIKRVLKDIAANFGEEAAATVGNELAALATYQQEVSPDLLQKTVYSGLVGAGLGGLVSGGTEVANRIGTPAPQQAPPPEAPPELPPPPAPPELLPGDPARRQLGRDTAALLAQPRAQQLQERIDAAERSRARVESGEAAQVAALGDERIKPRIVPSDEATPRPAAFQEELDYLAQTTEALVRAQKMVLDRIAMAAPEPARRRIEPGSEVSARGPEFEQQLAEAVPEPRSNRAEPDVRLALLDKYTKGKKGKAKVASPEPVRVPIVEPLPPQPEVVPQAPPAAVVQPEAPPPQPPTRKRKAGPSPAELDQLQAEAAPVEQESIPESLAKAAESQAERERRAKAVFDRFDDGTVIDGWTKITAGGDVFWTKGKKTVANLLTEIGAKKASAATGLDMFNPPPVEQAPAQPTAPTAAPPVQTVVPQQEAQNAQDAEAADLQRPRPGDQPGPTPAPETPVAPEAGRPAPAAVLAEAPDALRRQEGNQEGRQEVATTPPVPATVPEAVAPAEKRDTATDIQMYEDAIRTKREKGETVPPEWINRLAALKGGQEALPVGEVASLPVFGHPEATDIQPDLYGNLVPIKVSTVERVDRRIEKTQKAIDALQSRLVKRKGVKPLTAEEQDVLNRLRTETAPELQRLRKMLSVPAAPQGSGIVAGAAATKPIGPPLERPALTEATPEDAARLVEAAQPIPGPIGEKVQELGEPSALKSFVQRWLTSRRGLPETARKAMEAREGDIASTRAVAKDLGQSLDRAIYTHVKDLAAQQQKATGVEPDLTTIQDGVWEKANAVLDGAVAPKDSGLPQPILDRLRIFREATDKASQEAIDEEGMISDSLKEVFGERIGKYVTRTYLVHQIGGERRIRQLRRGGQAEWNAIRDEISAMPEFDGWSTEQIDGWMENELARFEPGRPTQESEGKPPGTQNLSIYKRRKDIPDPIRRLYGEIKNPAVRAFVTITNIRRNLDTFRMYKALREGGLKEGWLSEVEKPGFRAVEGSKATAPLQSRRSKKKGTEEEPGGPPRDSLFGKKEILDALRMADDGVRIPVVSWLTGAIKSAKTVYSVQAQVRNIMANPLLLLGGGNLGWAPWKRASLRGSLLEASREFKRGSRADAFADLSNVDMKDLAGAWGRAGKLGVTNTNPDLADIRAMMGAQIDADLPPGHRPLSAKELLSSDPTQMLGVRRGLKFVSEKMQTAYRLGDEFFKFVAWQNETAKIRYYRPELTQDQAEVLAADTVRDILPTDQRSIQFLRMLRQFPALGTFISFVSEIPRNAKNVVKLGFKEITDGKKAGNKKQMEVGIHRLASFVLATSAVPAIGVALAAAIKQATGLKDEEQDKLEAAARVYLPFYAKNQTLAVMKTGKGKALAFDLSFMDPWAVLKDPILTFFRTGILDEKDLDERLAAAAKETLDPYISEGLGLGLMFDLLRGRNARGIELWDPALPPDEKRRAMANYALRGVEPGTLTTARRIGYGIASEIDKARGGEGVKDPVNRREYDPVTELFAIAGMRPLPIDATTQLGFTARAYSDLTQRAGSQFRKEARASAAPEDKPRAEENYRYIYDQGMKELASGVAAARAFGLTDKEIDAILKESRISAEVRKKAMSPENAVLETLETLREKRLKEIEEEVDKERAARKKAAGR